MIPGIRQSHPLPCGCSLGYGTETGPWREWDGASRAPGGSQDASEGPCQGPHSTLLKRTRYR